MGTPTSSPTGRSSRTVAGSHKRRLIVGYRGLIDLHLRSGKVKSIVARPVYQADDFDVWDDEEGDHYRRRPALTADRGDIVRYYGRATLAAGGSFIHVMELEDIEARRQRSKAKDAGPWQTDPVAMSQKTVVRAMSPWLPASVWVSAALEADEQSYRFEGGRLAVVREDEAIPARSTARVSEASFPQEVDGHLSDPVVDEETGEIHDGSQDAQEPPPGDADAPQDQDPPQEAPRASGAPIGDVPQELLDRVQGIVESLPVARVREILRTFEENSAGSEKAIRLRCWQTLASAAHAGDQRALDLL